MKKYILIVFLLGFTFAQDTISGYLRSAEVSFCMDECGMYYIESEFTSDSAQTQIPIALNDEIDFEMYLNRFVEVVISDEEVNCVECSAFQALEINLSQDCNFPVACFVDPCDVAQDCLLNTPVDCVSNYCGGCHADFYDLNNNLVDCHGDDDAGPNPCSDFGYEDCEWFDECVWTDSGCQDANWEDECSGLSQDECASVDYCDWISDSDNPNSWGMCVEVDDEDGPPECLMDCEGIEYVNPDEDPYEACDWIVSTFGFDPGFGSCFDDCDEDTIMMIYAFVEGCYNCLSDTTFDCADVFDDEDDNDWECSDLDYEECVDAEHCEANLNAADQFESCVDSNNDDWECSDLGYEDCMWYDNCQWISDMTNLNGYCVDAEEPEGCFSDDGEWYCVGCELFINDCQYYDCTEEGWSDLITLDSSECNDNSWECSDIDNPYECHANEDCEWQLNSTGSGQCIESDDVEPVCEDLSDYFFGLCDMIIGIGWNGQECTWYSGCGTIDQNGTDHSDAFFDSIEECEAVCSDNQQGNGVLYGYVEYIWGDAIELVAGALIEIQGVAGNFLYTTQTNEEGFYQIELPQGPYIVTAQAYQESQVQDVYIMTNHEHELNFTFGEFYYEIALTGYVYGNTASGDFAPIENAHIVISNPNQWFNIDTSTDENGFFWVNLPATGMYNVSISADGYFDSDDYIYIQGITEGIFYLDTYNGGGDGYAALSLEDVTGSPGSEIAIPLLLESDLAVAGVQFSVYPLGEGFPNYLFPAGLNSTNDCFTANFNEVNGAFIGIIFSLEGCTYPESEVVHIADLIYEVSNDTPPGLELFLEFESTLVSDSEGNEILSYGEGANILFGSLGDVNSDEEINILDIVLIVSFAIYIEEPTNSQFWASDINGDNLINVLDIVQAVNLILDN